jgi:hypothetical protein
LKKNPYIRVAKIDPDNGFRALLRCRDGDMKEVRRLVGAKRVSHQLIANIDGIEVYVVPNIEPDPASKIWRVKDGLPVRGTAILYGDAGAGAASFPGDVIWLHENIEFDPAGVERAINDPTEKTHGEDH